MTPTIHSQPARPNLNGNALRLFAGFVLFMTVQAAVLFIAAGTFRWPAAWAYFGTYAVCYLIGLTWVASVNPAVINERGRKSTNTEGFDRRFHRVMPLVILSGLIIGGLDYRFDWSAMPAALQLVGLSLLIPSIFVAVWVLATNPYASRVVRLQNGHEVITTGPYRYVRHPMYSGTLLTWVAVALALGSWWMFVPASAGILLFVWRTKREDAVLHEKLPSYRKYAAKTRFRLVQGLW